MPADFAGIFYYYNRLTNDKNLGLQHRSFLTKL
jgi:hypothetical protein